MLNWFKKRKDNNKEIDSEDELTLEQAVEESAESEVEVIQEEINENLDKIDELIKEEIEDEELKQEANQESEEELEEGTKGDFDDEEIQKNKKIENTSQDREVDEEINQEESEIENIQDEPKKLSFFEKLKEGLTKTRDEFSNKIDGILKSYKKIDEELFDDLEEVLVTADVGVNTTMQLIDNLRARVKEEKTKEPSEVKELLKDEIRKVMMKSDLDNSLNIEPSPAVILVVGVNGVGKTTTIGKMSNNFKKQGKKVLIAAGDTFRAAAIEQLEEWGNRAGVSIISHKEGADPAAVVFDGIQAAKARGIDVLICDTAGRLHNKANLMQELNKIFRIVEREYGDARKEILLVLDATTGQNAINQARVFKEVANITGVALTKLDGTAKGGVIIALYNELNIPVKLVGVGEGIEDLQEFVVEDFVEALFE